MVLVNKAPSLFIYVFLLLTLVTTVLKPVHAVAPIHVAVASNFLVPARHLVNQFKLETGYDVVLISGASGNLYTQMIKGAPIDVFLSADSKLPQQLVKDDMALPESLYTYAEGQLVLWSGNSALQLNQHTVATWPHRLAIANPRFAPYGAAALEYLSAHDVLDSYQHRLIKANNVNQAFQFIDSGNVQLGMIPLSLLKVAYQKSKAQKYLHYYPLPNKPKIIQQMVILSRAQNKLMAWKWLNFVTSEKAQQYLASVGYIAQTSQQIAQQRVHNMQLKQ
ncbi:molybdate ABC transporter substrate-binding protein [Flocculibacter collagenilyticus]|uniref:molybdate ABC transporter substrate-binding protein n=1 Tax=Flocculibacter collagenilyticus TaxID=2744479 RepID=UPI0018F47454|nr:molybdate ABC transporter substrate-binding protein [Flocculibacter collagenilyticus]